MSRSRKNPGLVAVALVLCSLVPATGCNALHYMPIAKAEKRLSEDFKTSNAPKIVVDTFNGAIDVSRGNDGEVLVDVIKRASGIDQPTAEAALNTVQVTMVQKENTLTIHAERLERGPGSFGASVVIAVPAASQLELRTSNGHVVCEQVDGSIDAHTSNGRLEVFEGRGPMNLKTSNGTIEIDATDATVDAKTSNGRIEFRGTLADAKQQFKTSNGRIKLVVPGDSEFRFDGHTSNSRIQFDFPIDTGDHRRRRNDLEGVVGNDPDPACTIVASSSNGSIQVRNADEYQD